MVLYLAKIAIQSHKQDPRGRPKTKVGNASQFRFPNKFATPDAKFVIYTQAADPDQGECSNTSDANSLGQDSRANKIWTAAKV